MKWTVDALIFDFDGVVVNTGGDVASATNYILRSYGMQELPDDLIASYIGGGAEPLLKRVLGERTDELFDQALPLFKKRYAEHYLEKTYMYPGVSELLAHYAAAGKKMAIATNKVERITFGILDGLGIRDYFQVIIGPESITRRKPDPEAIDKILEQIQVPAGRSLMIGDTAADILAGKAAGSITCGVTYGYGTREEVEGSGPDFLIDRALQMLDFIE